MIGVFEDGDLVTKQSRNVHYCENKFLNESTSQKTDISESEENELIFELNERGSCEDISEETDNEVPSQNKAKVAPAVFSEPIQNRKSRYGRVIKPPNRYTPGNSGNLCFDSFSSEFENREDFAFTSNYVDQKLPKNLEEALSSPKWYAVMKAQFQSLQENQVWQLVDMPKRKNLVGGKWHFAIKRNSSGDITKYKARYVARKFKQKHGIDFDETYSPTIKMITVRMLLNLAVQREMNVKQLDIKTAS